MESVPLSVVLKDLMEFTCEAAYTWSFLYRKVFLITFKFFNKYKDYSVLVNNVFLRFCLFCLRFEIYYKVFIIFHLPFLYPLRCLITSPFSFMVVVICASSCFYRSDRRIFTVLISLKNLFLTTVLYCICGLHFIVFF